MIDLPVVPAAGRAVEAADEDVRSVTAFQRRARGERNQMTPEELRLAANFSASNPEEASAVLASEAGLVHLRRRKIGDLEIPPPSATNITTEQN